MGRKTINYILIAGLLLAAACAKKSTKPEDPLDQFLAGVSLGSDTLITDMTKPLIVSFVTLMDQGSVENAFSCTPQFEYYPHWTIETSFQPADPEVIPILLQFYLFHDTPFMPNTTYTCMIDTMALNDENENLPVQFEFQFTTAAPMLREISLEYDVLDSNRAFPIDIKLAFNTAIDISTIQQPFITDPEFEYELSGYSRQNHIFEYKIKTPIMAEHNYQIGISGDIFDIWGNRIDTDTSLQFNTGSIEVVYCFPNPHFNVKSKRPIIQVRFNTEMDMESVENAFSFGHEPGIMPGSFYWMTDKAVQFFYDQDLLEGETYTIYVGASATDTHGTPLKSAFSYTFVY